MQATRDRPQLCAKQGSVPETCRLCSCASTTKGRMRSLPEFSQARDHSHMRWSPACKEMLWLRARMHRKTVEEPYPGLSMTPAKFGCRFATSTAVRGRQSSQALRVKTAGVQTENRLGERFVLGSTPRNRGAPFVDRAAPKVGPRGSHPTIASAKPKWPSSAGSTTSSTTV